MKVHVKYVAQARTAAGVTDETVDLAGSAGVTALLTRLADQHGKALADLLLEDGGQPRATALVFVGDEQVDWDSPPPLGEGDKVTIVSPLSGG